MSRKRNLFIILLALTGACIAVYLVYTKLGDYVDEQQSIQVVVPNQFVDAGQRLSEHQLSYKTIHVKAFDDSMITKKERAIGMEVIIPLGEGEPVLLWKINRFSLLPEPGEATFQIPKNYILSIASGIRAGDQVQLYISEEEGHSKLLFNHSIVVAGVKSSNNQEIDNPAHSHLLSQAQGNQEAAYAARRDANAAIDQLNLNLTAEEWLLIDSLCKSNQAKLVVAFIPSSAQSVATTEHPEEGEETYGQK